MIALETINDLQNVISTNNATVSGVLLAVCVAFGSTIFYLFKSTQKMIKDCQEKNDSIQERYITELKNINESLLKVNTSYQDISLKVLKDR